MRNENGNISRVIGVFLTLAFEWVHRQHYRSSDIKTIKILGFRSALIEEYGQRKRVSFYFKVGKNYL